MTTYGGVQRSPDWRDGYLIGKIDGRKELMDEMLRYDPSEHRSDDQHCCPTCDGVFAIWDLMQSRRMYRRELDSDGE